MEHLDKESAKLLKVDELKSALKARRCSTSGKKAELYGRLATFFDAESIENQVSQVAESASNAILENDPKLEESKTSANSKEDPDSVKVALISSAEKKFEEPKNTSIARTNEGANDLQSTTITDGTSSDATSLATDNIDTTDEIVAIAESSGSTAVTQTAENVVTDAGIAVTTESTNNTVASAELDKSSTNAESAADHQEKSQESKSSSITEHAGAIPTKSKEMDIVTPEGESEVGVESLASDEHIAAVDDKKSDSETTSDLTGVNDSTINEDKKSTIENATEENKETIKVSEVKRFHVRIDNFQRPLTEKLLFEWLATTLGHEVLKEHLWMNKIKTHCYIDFETLERAEACKVAVTGQKVDSKHSSHLVASSTEISASEAESSVEGNLKPSEWKNHKAGTVSSSGGAANVPPVQTSIQITRPVSGNVQVSMSNSSIEMVRKAALQSINSSNRMTVSHDLGSGGGVSGNEIIGFSTKRNSSAAGISQEQEQDNSKRQNTGPGSNPHSLMPNVYAQRESWRQAPEVQNFTDSLALDELFRKTQALPPLYWLPVSDEIVAKRNLHNSKS